jgi:hypothetical protein
MAVALMCRDCTCRNCWIAGADATVFAMNARLGMHTDMNFESRIGFTKHAERAEPEVSSTFIVSKLDSDC